MHGQSCRHLPPHPAGLPRARIRQNRAEEARPGGRQRGHRPWAARQTLEIRRGELRSAGNGGNRCTALVTASARVRQRWPRPRSTSSTRKNHSPPPSAPHSRAKVTAASATPRWPAGWTSCARVWVSTRSRPCRRPPSTRPLARLIAEINELKDDESLAVWAHRHLAAKYT